MSVTERSGYTDFGHVVWRTGTVTAQAPDMTGGTDLDLIEYTHWARAVRGYSTSTIRVRMDLLQRLSTYLGIPLREAAPGHLLAFERLAIAGRAAETKRAYVCHLRSFYRWAKRTGLVSEDPTELLTLPPIPRRLPRPIAEDDLMIALDAARPKLRAMLTLAAFGGLRALEIAGLNWSDVQRDTSGAAFIHIRKGKGGHGRTVEVGEVVIRALQAYGFKRNGPMFIGRDGLQIEAKSVSKIANRHLARNGVDATLHQLRHRYATIGYQLSHDLRLIQEQLGHASPQTTAGYARPSPEAAARMVRQMDALALGPSNQAVSSSLVGGQGEGSSRAIRPRKSLETLHDSVTR